MNDNQFYDVWGDALATQDSREAFISDWATSSTLLDPDTPDVEIDMALVEQLGKIYDAAHMGIKDLRNITGLTQAKFAKRFCIPQRTVEAWESTAEGSHRDCPTYVRLLIARQLGII